MGKRTHFSLFDPAFHFLPLIFVMRFLFRCLVVLRWFCLCGVVCGWWGNFPENGSAEEGVRGHYLEHREGVGGSDSGFGGEGAPAAAKPVTHQGRFTGHASPIEGDHGLQGDGSSFSYFALLTSVAMFGVSLLDTQYRPWCACLSRWATKFWSLGSGCGFRGCVFFLFPPPS